MTSNRQKIIIMISFFIFFIALLVIFLLTASDIRSAIWVIYSVIVAIAAVSVVVALIANRALNKKISSLPEDYREVYLNAQDLISLHSKSYRTRKEVMEMILEIFEHAALEERDINEVIRNDIEQFVKEFLVDKQQKFNIRYILLYSTSLYLFFILFMKIYKVLRADTISVENFKTEPLDVGITLTYFIIAYAMYPLLMYTIHYSAKKQLNSYKRLIIVIPALIPLVLMFALIFIDNPSMRNFLDTPTAFFSSIYTFIIGVIFFIVTTTLTIYTKE